MLINLTIAVNIRLLRKAQGLSVDQACKAAGIRRGSWIRLEAAQGNPTLGTLVAVAYTLNTPVTGLIQANEEPPAIPPHQ
jgi:transcriptional regulator with XRE-family HTH domain